MSSTTPTPRARESLFLGRYRIRRKLGSGSAGTVYHAFDEVERRDVALKVLRSEAIVAGTVGRIQDEFRALAALAHPQIARAYDFGYTQPGGVPFYTSEYIEGVPLPPGPPRGEEPAAFLRPLLDLLEALKYLHEHGILHLDIHAGNLIVPADEKRGAVLIDFGLVRGPEAARLPLSAASWTALPPELLAERQPAPAADIYLAGRLLLYRLTGRTRGEPSLPREIPGWGARLTLELERIAAKAVEREPEKRFRSAAEMHASLAKALGRSETPREVEPRQSIYGRDAELRAIDAVFDELARGQPSLLWLAGKTGVGKSRLLAEARLRAQLRGVTIVEARFSSGSTLLEELTRMRPRLRGALAWIEALLPAYGGTPEERAQRAAAAYFGQPEAPLALLLDDADRADRENRLLLEALLAECRRRRERGETGRALALIASSAALPGGPRSPARAGMVVRGLRPLARKVARRLFLEVLGGLSPPPRLVAAALSAAGGSPLRLRWIAAALRAEWRGTSVLPETARLPAGLPGLPGSALPAWDQLDEDERRVLSTLAVLARPATLAEIAAGAPAAAAARTLRRLAALELAESRGRGRACLWLLPSVELGQEIAAALPAFEVPRIHRRLATFLRARKPRTEGEEEALVTHVLATGRTGAGIRLAVAAARRLRARGFPESALRLLERAAAAVEPSRRRVEILEFESEVLGELGDHQRGIACLLPLRKSGSRVGRGARVRIERRLGVHYHRAGQPREALAAFALASRLADPSRDRRDLIQIDSELAEIRIFSGDYAAAQSACERGLERLDRLGRDDPFRGRMEVMLRASLGHIALRRLDLKGARRELGVALRLSRRHGTPGDRAAILQNLGVAESESCRLARARRYFEESERLLVRAGERQDLIKVSTNLAVNAAKLGDRRAAEGSLEKVASLLRQRPGKRLECFAAYSRGLASHLLGDVDEAARAFAAAIELARSLADSTMEAFASAYAAEASFFAGRYRDARRSLDAAASLLSRHPNPALARLVASRSYALEAVLGRRRRAAEALARWEGTERTSVVYLETWNDLFVALGRLVGGDGPAADIERARAAFVRLKLPSGERLARLGLLVEALGRHDADRARALLSAVGKLDESSHRFLRAAEPVAAAAACILLGETEKAGERLAVASRSIVGSPFLEVDWQLEFLKARLALGAGDRREAQRHLHRAIHCRDLVVQLVPEGARKRFLEHARFAGLKEAESDLNPRAHVVHDTEQLRSLSVYESMVGRSAPMLAVYHAIERLRDQALPVLLSGETGTGKELAARALHTRSARREQPFRIVHCACLPPELFESELFGHAAGAFTGAVADRPGLIADAGAGTLVLDDVHQLPLESQSKVLAVLDAGAVRPVGSTAAVQVAARFVATTSTDLRRAVAEGRFHAALYYRLAAAEIRLPPLRERRDDVGLLARHLLERHAERLDRGVPALAAEAVQRLEGREWPGNVRELEAVLLRVMIGLSRARRIESGDLEEAFRAPGPAASRGAVLLSRSLGDWRRDLERDYVTALFRELRGDAGAVIRALGMRRTRFYEWCRELGIDLRRLRREL